MVGIAEVPTLCSYRETKLKWENRSEEKVFGNRLWGLGAWFMGDVTRHSGVTRVARGGTSSALPDFVLRLCSTRGIHTIKFLAL